MKRLYFICVIVALFWSNNLFAYDIAVENADGVTIYYNYINDSKELEVTYGDNKYTNNVVIPGEVTYMNRTRKVTSIGKAAFKSCHELTSITIPTSVTIINWEAFYECSGLTSVTIPNYLQTIGRYSFSGCKALTTLIIPNSVTFIGYNAFDGCSGLTSVNIGNNVSLMEYNAFNGCNALTAVHISDLSAWCKIGCDNSRANPLFYAHHLYMNNSEVTNLIIPDGTEYIGSYTFYGCNGLESVTIPNSVTYIGGGAFQACSNFTSIISQIENPFIINGKSSTDGKSSSTRTFDLDIFNNITLYVPKGTIDKYKATEGWKDFLYIEEGTGPNGGETPKKCSTPTISYQNGKLIFRCDTEGATCQYSITDDDVKSGSSNEIQLGVTYCINVYATKTGYVNSETATATLCWIDAEPKTEGITNVAQIRAKAVMIQSNGNVLSVSGADEGTEINVYDTAGRMVGSSVATSDITNITTSLDSSSIGIIRIGEKAVKVLIK